VLFCGDESGWSWGAGGTPRHLGTHRSETGTWAPGAATGDLGADGPEAIAPDRAWGTAVGDLGWRWSTDADAPHLPAAGESGGATVGDLGTGRSTTDSADTPAAGSA